MSKDAITARSKVPQGDGLPRCPAHVLRLPGRALDASADEESSRIDACDGTSTNKTEGRLRLPHGDADGGVQVGLTGRPPPLADKENRFNKSLSKRRIL
jgi:hypothetical protein